MLQFQWRRLLIEVSSSVALMIVLQVSIVHGQSQDEGRLENTNLITRWESEDQGRIAFTSGRLNGPARGRLCVMNLPHREVTCIELPEELNAQYGSGAPKWFADGFRLVFAAPQYGESGIFMIDLRDRSTKKLSSGTRLPPLSGPRDLIPFKLKSGHTALLDPPSYSKFDKEFELSTDDSYLYVLRNYEVCKGLPGWTIDPDTLAVESGDRERLRARLKGASGERRVEWNELWRLDIDSSGSQSMLTDSLPFSEDEGPSKIFSLSAAPDGQHVALSSDKSVAIVDLTALQTIWPKVPSEFDVRYARFSSNGERLAACAVHALYPQFHSTYVMVAEGPDFSNFKPLAELSGLNPLRLAWSPDDSWILVVCREPSPAEAGTELYVLEVETGQYFKIAKPYFLGGMPAEGFYVDGDIDWTR